MALEETLTYNECLNALIDCSLVIDEILLTRTQFVHLSVPIHCPLKYLTSQELLELALQPRHNPVVDSCGGIKVVESADDGSQTWPKSHRDLMETSR
jgi:hypothetical protein